MEREAYRLIRRLGERRLGRSLGRPRTRYLVLVPGLCLEEEITGALEPARLEHLFHRRARKRLDEQHAIDQLDQLRRHVERRALIPSKDGLARGGSLRLCLVELLEAPVVRRGLAQGPVARC